MAESTESAQLIGQLDPSKTKWMGIGNVCAGARTDPDVTLVGFSVATAIGVPTIVLAADVEIDAAESLRVVGFGRSDQSNESVGIKRAAVVAVVSARCQGEAETSPGRTYASVFECIEQSEIIAGVSAESTRARATAAALHSLPISSPRRMSSRTTFQSMN